jgi:hypothetical protein
LVTADGSVRPAPRRSKIVRPEFYVRFVASAGAFDQAIDDLRGCVDRLLAADVSELTEAALVEALRSFETQRRRLEAVEHRLTLLLVSSPQAALSARKSSRAM